MAQVRWSSPATWGGTLPALGQDVVISAAMNVLLDVPPASLSALGNLTIAGTVEFDRTQDLTLIAKSINGSGSLIVGTTAAPYTKKALIRLTGAAADSPTTPTVLAGSPSITINDNDGMSRGLMVSGTLSIVGVPPNKTWTKLGDHAAKSATTLTLMETVNWKAGDQIVVFTTNHYNATYDSVNTFLTTLTADASGTTLSFADPLPWARCGKLQWQNETSPGVGFLSWTDLGWRPSGVNASCPYILDERAVVCNLTRNIVLEGADDADWANLGFGAHTMFMRGASVLLNGVEFRRVGQQGIRGRYALHGHMMSYNQPNGIGLPTDGTFVGNADVTITNCSVHQSANRGTVIHGTCGAAVRNNVYFDIKGHCLFLEDAVEEDNVFDANCVSNVRVSPQPLQRHEGSNQSARGPSGFWITNPKNQITNNHFGNCFGLGYWFSLPNSPLGLCKNVARKPINMLLGLVQYNTAHSNGSTGGMFDLQPIDDAGNTGEVHYQPKNADGMAGGPIIQVQIKGQSFWKNSGIAGNLGGYIHRVDATTYDQCISADNPETFFKGAAAGTTQVQNSLLIGTSLNVVPSGLPDPQGAAPPAAFALYNEAVSIVNNLIFGFTNRASSFTVAGFIDWHDDYIYPVMVGQSQNSGNRFINSGGGTRIKCPQINQDDPANNYTLCGAVLDPYGWWGPAGNYWVYDKPFFTFGAASITPVDPDANGVAQNGVSIPNVFRGIDRIVNDYQPDISNLYLPVNVERLDPVSGAVVGVWNVPVGTFSNAVTGSNMRHYAVQDGGVYRQTNRGKPPGNKIGMGVINAHDPAANFLVGVAMNCRFTTIRGCIGAVGYPSDVWGTYPQTQPDAGGARVVWLTEVASLALVKSGNGGVFWVDRANNLVWFKYLGTFFTRYFSDPQSATPYDITLSREIYYKRNILAFYGEGTATAEPNAAGPTSWNLIQRDTFNRAPTTVGNGVQSTTGIGNGWIDHTGNLFSIDANGLSVKPGNFSAQATPPFAYRPQAYGGALVPGVNENSLNTRAVVRFVQPDGVFHTVLRYNASAQTGYRIKVNKTGLITAQHMAPRNVLSDAEITIGNVGAIVPGTVLELDVQAVVVNSHTTTITVNSLVTI